MNSNWICDATLEPGGCLCGEPDTSSSVVPEVRYRCTQGCDFDYCGKCYVGKLLLHPGNLLNSDGVVSTLSYDNHHTNTMLHYCGRQVGHSGYANACGHCDGRCGPSNGCQCTACFSLDDNSEEKSASSVGSFSSSVLAETFSEESEAERAQQSADQKVDALQLLRESVMDSASSSRSRSGESEDSSSWESEEGGEKDIESGGESCCPSKGGVGGSRRHINSVKYSALVTSTTEAPTGDSNEYSTTTTRPGSLPTP